MDDQRNDEADKGQGLDERGAKNEGSEQTALHLGLTGHCGRCAIGRKTDADAGTNNTKTISDDSHDSSFITRLAEATL